MWNCDRFLAKAVASIVSQTFESFELLIVDDGSTDRSHDIAVDFASRDPRVIVLRVEHAGLVNALNAGLAAARGEFIARMDADDFSHPSRLAKQVAYLDAHPGCVAVGSDVVLIDEEGESLGYRRFPSKHASIVSALLDGWTHAFCHPSVVMRAAAAARAGGYDARRFPCEDLDLWLRLAENGELANLNEPLLDYRKQRDAISVRERVRQVSTAAAVVNAARDRHGMRRPPLAIPLHHAHRDPRATYHFDCARIALQSGHRHGARRHALASARHAPFWWRPYAAFAVSSLPQRAFAFVMKLFISRRSRKQPADATPRGLASADLSFRSSE